MASAAESASALIIGGASSNRKKCTAEVFPRFPFEIFVGDRIRVRNRDLHPHPVFEALQPRKHAAPLVDIRI